MNQNLSPSRYLGGAIWLSCFLSIPLSLFVTRSFLSARELYLERAEHLDTSRFTAALVSLMLWTAFLSLDLLVAFLQIRRRLGRRRDNGAESRL